MLMDTMEDQLARIRDQAKALYQLGRLPESLAAHDAALRLAPENVVIRLSAARLAHLLERQDASLRHFEEAVRLDPRCYQAVEAARRICVGAGMADRAERYSRLAHELNPTADALLSQKLMVPSIMESTDAIQASREHYARGLKELSAAPPTLAAPEGALGISAFFLAYHGQNDRDLQIGTARLFQRVIPALEFTAPHCLTPRRGGGKIRIGFISRFFASHSIFSTSVGLIEKLSRERFEVIALRINPSRDDESTARIRRGADRTLDLDADLFRARDQIAALELDILFYQDIGMETTSYFLAFARLAPVQCVSFGHPNTTGIPAMDYFISNDLFEPQDAAEHYSERLVQLRDLPTLAYYYKPPVPSSPRQPRVLRVAGFGYVVRLPPDSLQTASRLRRYLARNTRGRPAGGGGVDRGTIPGIYRPVARTVRRKPGGTRASRGVFAVHGLRALYAAPGPGRRGSGFDSLQWHEFLAAGIRRWRAGYNAARSVPARPPYPGDVSQDGHARLHCHEPRALCGARGPCCHRARLRELAAATPFLPAITCCSKMRAW